MKKTIKILSTLLILLILVLVIMMFMPANKFKESKKIKILTSFYPIYVMTLNITDGVENVETSNMADQFYGCIHDYTLTTEDLKKVEKSDIFIQSGEGLEPFADRIVNNYKNLKVISCSDKVSEFIENDEGEINAHTWLGIENYKKEVEEIAEKLSTIDLQNANKYQANKEKYLEALTSLQNQYKTLNLQNQKAICMNESLEYLLKENSIEETLVETDHEQSALSADTIKDLIEKIKSENIKNIFVDINDNTKSAETLANETGAKIYTLNSAMSGLNDKDDFIRVMEQNYLVLKQLGE